MNHIWCQPLLLKPPSSHERIDTVSRWFASIRYDVADVASDDTATPARISVVTDDLPPERAMPYVANTATSAPPNAARVIRLTWPHVAGTGPTITAVAASPAPAATPSRYGSASGLRNTPWYAAPL